MREVYVPVAKGKGPRPNPKSLRFLGDVDGGGLAELIELGKNGARVLRWQSGEKSTHPLMK